MRKKYPLISAVLVISSVLIGCSEEKDQKIDATTDLPDVPAETSVPQTEQQPNGNAEVPQTNSNAVPNTIFGLFDTVEAIGAHKCLGTQLLLRKSKRFEELRTAYDWTTIRYDRVGTVSRYADSLHGNHTAPSREDNPVLYDKTAFTAASRHFPYGSLVQVTRLATGKSVIVRVNDCGPFAKHRPFRVLDLSRAAFEVLGDVRRGHLTVRVTFLGLDTAENGAQPGAQSDLTAPVELPPDLRAEAEQIPEKIKIAVEKEEADRKARQEAREREQAAAN